MRSVMAMVTFKNGTGHIAKYSLKGNLPFTKEEIKKWIKDLYKCNVKSVVLLGEKG